jgi:hypothetical protein
MMTATAILDLERAGFRRERVEALARWHETGLDLSHLVTKADLADVRTELADLRNEIVSVVGLALAILRPSPYRHP